ncbi:hypothetical protein [Spirosoma koreense]
MYFLLLLVSCKACALSLFIHYRIRSGPYTAIRIAFVQTLILHGLLIFTYNELFSPFNLITPLTARLYWLVMAMAACGWLFRSAGGWAGLAKITRELLGVLRLTGIDGRSRFLLYTGVVLLILPLLMLAVLAPPNNYDSHMYHLTRVLYWLSDQNLDHFPTMHIQQLYHNVFAEYLVLHTFLLVGSDQLANVIQYGAMLGSVLSVSLLAKQLGLTYRGQLLAGILMACLPIGLFESTTTQNDYVACFFFLGFVLFGYQFLRQPVWYILACCLLSLVFGSFTKYPVLFFALPFVLYFAIQILRRQGFQYGLVTLAGAVLLFCLVFGPFFARNYAIFGAILSPTDTSRLATEKIPVDKFSIPYSISNVIKNAGLHVGAPYLPYNQQMDSLVVRAHRLMGVKLEEPAISKDRFHVRFSMQEDMAPNTIHFFLLLIMAVILFTRRGHGPAKLLFGMALIGFVLYSSVFKFQLFSSRVHMPFFALGCVSIAYTYEAVLKRTGFFLALVLYVLSLLVVLGNPSKMIIPIRYLAQRVLAHVPRYICSSSESQRQRFYGVLQPYYESIETPYCLSLRQSYGYSDRSAVFDKLDSMDYFRHDKEESILFESRTQAYFANHQSNYDAFAPLLAHIGPDAQNIGFFPVGDSGFYHYWSALNQHREHPVGMAYIRYAREYAKLPNAQRPFCYNYILSDDAGFVRLHIPADAIAETHTSGRLTLFRLKHSSCQTYQY